MPPVSAETDSAAIDNTDAPPEPEPVSVTKPTSPETIPVAEVVQTEGLPPSETYGLQEPSSPAIASVAETPSLIPPPLQPFEPAPQPEAPEGSAELPSEKAAPEEPPEPPPPVVESPLSPKQIQSILDEALDFSQAAQDFWQKGELENAIEALDQAYSLILKIDQEQENLTPELSQQKEDLRFLISKRILEIYASRNIVVNGMHNAIPIDINRHVQREIDLFTKGRERSFFVESYKRSGRYRDRIISALKEAGLPAELSWLPLIESGFKVNALSRARALGLWQFIPSTGYKFGLKRNVFIDERLDPDKATKAAIAYLKELHQIFGDWTTVLAAYNCGEGRVLRVIRDQNVNYLDDFWDLYMRLPLETARYVPRFLATLHILKNAEKYGLDKIATDEPIAYDSVTIAKQVHLRDVAHTLGISNQQLKLLNPELRYEILPQESYSLNVPPGKGSLLLANINQIPTSSRPRPAFVKHRVRPGETLSSIAVRYRTSMQSIARANNIHKRNYIVAGKTLKIPQKGSITYQTTVHTTASPKSTGQQPRPSEHIVRSGDSLWILAKNYGTTTKEIQTLNGLSETMLHIGQVLKIPGSKPVEPVTADTKSYIVRRGDSPFKIAQRHKIPLEQFLRINRLTPRSKIFPGQRLVIE